MQLPPSFHPFDHELISVRFRLYPVDAANSLSPSPIPSHSDLPKGKPGAGKDNKPKIIYDARKASRILGPELKYHSVEETTRDTLADFEKRGW